VLPKVLEHWSLEQSTEILKEQSAVLLVEFKLVIRKVRTINSLQQNNKQLNRLNRFNRRLNRMKPMLWLFRKQVSSKQKKFCRILHKVSK